MSNPNAKGRPRLSESEDNAVRISFSISPEDFAAFSAEAKSLGVTKSELFRLMLKSIAQYF